MVTEERVEQIPVQVCKTVAVEQTVRVGRVVQKQVPVTYVQRVPRTVVLKIPVAPCCGPCCDSDVIDVPAVPVAMPAVPVAPPPTGTYEPAPARPSRPAPESTYDEEPAPARPAPRSRVTPPATDANERPALQPSEKVGPVDEEAEAAGQK